MTARRSIEMTAQELSYEIFEWYWEEQDKGRMTREQALARMALEIKGLDGTVRRDTAQSA